MDWVHLAQDKEQCRFLYFAPYYTMLSVTKLYSAEWFLNDELERIRKDTAVA